MLGNLLLLLLLFLLILQLFSITINIFKFFNANIVYYSFWVPEKSPSSNW